MSKVIAESSILGGMSPTYDEHEALLVFSSVNGEPLILVIAKLILVISFSTSMVGIKFLFSVVAGIHVEEASILVCSHGHWT